MIILSLDPATSCGWAVLADGERVDSGVWDLSIPDGESEGMRWRRFRKRFDALIAEHKPDVVGYELVRQRHKGNDAARVYFRCTGHIIDVCEKLKIDYSGVEVGTIKRTATGKGNASKEAMVAAAIERFGITPKTDDEADALFVGLALHKELTE